MPSPKAIIFDLGKVIFDLSTDRIFQYWSEISKIPYTDLKETLQLDELNKRLECDEISAEEFRQAVSKQVGFHFTDEEFDAGWCNLYLELYPGIDEFLRSLKENYQIVALTNTNAIHAKVWNIKYSATLAHFEKIFSSHEIKLRKPDKNAYQKVLDDLEVEPHETVFLDDNSENIKSAEEMGIKSILVRSPEQMMNSLKQILLIH